MRNFCPSAIFDYLGGQMGDKTGEKLQMSKLKVKNLQKRTIFRIISIFAFRCMVKLPLIGAEIAPAIAIKFSGLV